MQLRHGRVSLALHERKAGEGDALLLLHELRGSSADWPGAVDAWAGPVLALDFSGHGDSAWVRGGAYFPELLVGDADAALEATGAAVVAGAGLGAWVTLLLAAARPEQVRAALLLPGRGLSGGGAVPDFDREDPIPPRRSAAAGPEDPAVELLERDVRPVDYATDLAGAACRLLFVEPGDPVPPWWEAARRSPAAEPTVSDLAEAIARLASG